ncbi:DUF6531 domain-containing protein [Enterobacterales bacterium AE_CKDN230030158-1A_HGKHYDSX7]
MALSTNALADYWWVNAGDIYAEPYPTPEAACTWTINYNDTYYRDHNLDYTLTSNTMEYIRDDFYRCTLVYYSAKENRTKVPHGVLYRRGTPCSTGSFNKISGTCTQNEEKGDSSYACSPSPDLFALNPINISNGNKFQKEFDYSSPSSSSLALIRYYNGLDGTWRHNYSSHLKLIVGIVGLVRNDGRETSFPVSGEVVSTPPGESGVIRKNNQDWVYSDISGEEFTYNNEGRLTTWKSADNKVIHLIYTDSNIIIEDEFGEHLELTEDNLHQPLKLQTSTGEITYSYSSSGALTQVDKKLQGKTTSRKYHYEDPQNPKLLTGITDELGIRYATWSYDDKGRAVESLHAGQADHGSVTYNSDGSTSVTNEYGKKTTYRFQAFQGVKRVTSIQGEPTPNCPYSNSVFTYDTNGLLKTRTDAKGNLTTYDYNDRGLETSRTEAAGSPQARTITTEWHPTLFLKTKVTEPSRITTYQYDAQGRQTGQIVTPR